MQTSRHNFDFDAWRQLAEHSPEDFERQRRSAVEKVINGQGCNTRRLLALQTRIDLEILRAKTPLNACLRLSVLMWDYFDRLRETFDKNLMRQEPRQLPASKKTAQIIAFPARK
ncbi:DUF3135 domain-containing protein [Novimethylophilus kurashikiensis]|nr:DUF3135 domain-containing protein [Novimethylophilus kurashikiensis]